MRAGTNRFRTAVSTLVVASALLLTGLLAVPGVAIAPASSGSIPVARAMAAHPDGATSGAPAVAEPLVVRPPTWSNVTRTAPGASPPALASASVAYDPVDRTTVLFGGCLANQCPSEQTWIFANGTWTNVTRPSDAPPARENAAIDFDANMAGLLLFGGLGAGSVPLNDTWLFAAGRWTNLTYVGGGPSPRYGAMMAFDSAPEENGSVLFGGCVASGFGVTCSNDTWVWQGWAGWVSFLPSADPPAVGFGAMTYDPVDSEVVLFGGCAGFLCLGSYNQTWVFYSGQWWQLAPATSPPARSSVAMVFDPAIEAVLLFGGLNASFVSLSDTWSFSGGAWQLLNPAAAPAPRSAFGLALDPSGEVPLLVGGNGPSASSNDTWAFEVTPRVTLGAASPPHESGAAVPLTAAVTGGSGSFGLAITFGNGAGSFLAGHGPSFEVNATYAVTGQYVPGVNLTDSAGVTSAALAPAITVQAGPSLTATADPAQVDAGLPVHFAANASDAGSPPFTFAWWFGDGATGTGASAIHGYGAPGVYAAYANLTDTAGGTASYPLSVTVVALPTVSIIVGSSAPNSSSPVPVRATVAGGTGPYHFAWSFGDGTTSVLPSPTHRFAAGTYTLQVWANDSVGGGAHATATVTVGAGSTPNAPSNSAAGSTAPDWFWAGLGVLAAVAVVGAILLARRGRRA